MTASPPHDPEHAIRALSQHATAAAPLLLGSRITAGDVTIRVTEVEAYGGVGTDPGSHCHRGKTNRNASMFGPPGHAYVYFTYGMHHCLNVVCQPEGTAGGCLIRAGEVVDGHELATQRRPGAAARDLARGPARLTVALGIDRRLDGTHLLGDGQIELSLRDTDIGHISSGPRTGVGGDGALTPWRFWLTDDPTVSPYRPHQPKNRSRTPRAHA
ncbi:Putative 3-methyladenine DNA glycosylase [Stackebrandtia soli]